MSTDHGVLVTSAHIVRPNSLHQLIHFTNKYGNSESATPGFSLEEKRFSRGLVTAISQMLREAVRQVARPQVERMLAVALTHPVYPREKLFHLHRFKRRAE